MIKDILIYNKMETRTLAIDKELYEEAQRFANSKGADLTKLVEAYLKSLLKEEGYKSEQISYVLRLAEEGVTPSEMEEFIHPGISIDMMEKIRRMKKKNRNKDVEES